MMTGEQIIKALECCENNTCFGCPFYVDIGFKCKGADAQLIDLINRQQAEIERLKEVARINANTIFGSLLVEFLRKEARAEANKEFAERLKKSLNNWIPRPSESIINSTVDKIVKDMIGEGNV